MNRMENEGRKQQAPKVYWWRRMPKSLSEHLQGTLAKIPGSRRTKVTIAIIALLASGGWMLTHPKQRPPISTPQTEVPQEKRWEIQRRQKGISGLMNAQKKYLQNFLKEALWNVYEERGKYGFSKGERKALVGVTMEYGIPCRP